MIDYAIEKKLSGIAITDHDTIEGISEALEYVKNKHLELISGIEISCDCEERVKEIHIVRLFIDYTNSEFKKLKLENERKGKKKAKEIIKKFLNTQFNLLIYVKKRTSNNIHNNSNSNCCSSCYFLHV